MELNLNVESANISGVGRYAVRVEMTGVSETEIFDQITVSDLVRYFGLKDLVEGIGLEEIKAEFNLTDNKDED